MQFCPLSLSLPPSLCTRITQKGINYVYMYVRGLQANQKVAQDLWHLLLLLPVLPLPLLPVLLSLVIGTSMLILKSAQVLRERKQQQKGNRLFAYTHTHTHRDSGSGSGGRAYMALCVGLAWRIRNMVSLSF